MVRYGIAIHIYVSRKFSVDFNLAVVIYRMAGNFRGVLIFVIFVIDLAVTKFSHPEN